jgi:3-phosphoshikimate 1-carboxyvinyltransferase
LAHGKTVIHNYLKSPDTSAMVQALQTLGVRIGISENRLEITGGINSADNVIDAGNSGLVLRLVGAISGLLPSYTIITGDESIRHSRPAQPLLDGLSQMGAFAISSKGDGHAPLIIKGPIQGSKIALDGADSQPVSGLIIAAAFAHGMTEIHVTNPGEKPWVALTLNWLDQFGIPYVNDNFEKYTLFGHARIEGFEYEVPSDFSSAAYPIIAALITHSELTIDNLDMEDGQGDKEVISLLQKLGAHITKEGRSLHIQRGEKLKGGRIDVNAFIDALPILAVLGCFAEGVTEIVGGAIARKKESDRISSIVQELTKMGAHIFERGDDIVIEPSHLHGAHVESHADHRIAMSLSVAAMGAHGHTTLNGEEFVAKSYPSFFDQMKMVGASIE